MNVKATDVCKNCGREFADHNYVKDSITEYKCPHPMQQSVYGFFTGGDPRSFHPDEPECRQEEIDNWKKACELWNEAESRGETPDPEKCHSGFIFNDKGECLGQVLGAPYGIGVQTYVDESYFEPIERDDEPEESDGPF